MSAKDDDYMNRLLITSQRLMAMLKSYSIAYTCSIKTSKQSINAPTKIDYQQSIFASREEVGGKGTVVGCLCTRRWLIAARPRGIRLIAPGLAYACLLCGSPALYLHKPTLFKKSARSSGNKGSFYRPRYVFLKDLLRKLSSVIIESLLKSARSFMKESSEV